MSNKQYIIVDIINQEFFKEVDGTVKVFTDYELAELYCGIHELDNAWICELISNYIEQPNEQ